MSLGPPPRPRELVRRRAHATSTVRNVVHHRRRQRDRPSDGASWRPRAGCPPAPDRHPRGRRSGRDGLARIDGRRRDRGACPRAADIVRPRPPSRDLAAEVADALARLDGRDHEHRRHLRLGHGPQSSRHETWRRLVDVNLMGPIHVIEELVPPMIDAGRGGHLRERVLRGRPDRHAVARGVQRLEVRPPRRLRGAPVRPAAGTGIGVSASCAPARWPRR